MKSVGFLNKWNFFFHVFFLDVDQKSATTDENKNIKTIDLKSSPQNLKDTKVEETIEIANEEEEVVEEETNYEDDDFPQHEPMYQPEDPGQIDEQLDEPVERTGHDEL